MPIMVADIEDGSTIADDQSGRVAVDSDPYRIITNKCRRKRAAEDSRPYHTWRMGLSC